MAFERFNLKGKTALITGSGGLLGVQHAAALLESNAVVVITDVNDDALCRARQQLRDQRFKSSKIITHVLDVSLSESINAVASSLRQSGVRIDILINNAAIDPKVHGKQHSLDNSRLENFSVAEWNLQVAVGLTGAVLCSQIFGTAMALDGKGGVILNIASDLSVIAPDQRIYRKKDVLDNKQPVKPVTYSVIKAGLIGLTRYLATYWADKGVRCNALSPGGVFNDQGDEFVSRLSSLIPLGRMARKDEYRAAIQFLCSDAASYMNGQNVVIDGGRTVW